MACYVGHVDCLAFALEHGCPVTHWALGCAVKNGHLACVELLVDQGLPEVPFLHSNDNCVIGMDPASARIQGGITPQQWRCIQYILDKGRPIDTGTLITAARNGNVDFVRYLHSAGVPLWDAAWEDDGEDAKAVFMECTCSGCDLYQSAWNKIVPVPRDPEHAHHTLRQQTP
jgi:hypothetical protein